MAKNEVDPFAEMAVEDSDPFAHMAADEAFNSMAADTPKVTMTPERATLIKANERQAAIDEADRLGSDLTRVDPQAIAEGVRTAYESAIPFGRKISAGIESVIPDEGKPLKQRYNEAMARREVAAIENPIADMGGNAASMMYAGGLLGKAAPVASTIPGMAIQAGLEGSVGGLAGQALSESQGELSNDSVRNIAQAGYDWKSIVPGMAAPVVSQVPRIFRAVQSKVAAGKINRTPGLDKALAELPSEPSKLPEELRTATKEGQAAVLERNKAGASKATEDINLRKQVLDNDAANVTEEIRLAKEQGSPVADKEQYLADLESQRADLTEQMDILDMEGNLAAYDKKTVRREGIKSLPEARQRLEEAHQILQDAASSKQNEIGKQIDSYLKNAVEPTEGRNAIKLALKNDIKPILKNQPVDVTEEYNTLIDNVLDGYENKVLTRGEKIEAIRRVRTELGNKGKFDAAGPIKSDPAMARTVRKALENSQIAATPQEVRALISSHEPVYDAQNLIKSMSKKGLSIDVKPGLEASPGKAGSMSINPKFEAQARKVLEPLAPEATRDFAESAQQIANKGVDPKQIEALEEKIHSVQGQKLKLKKERNAVKEDPAEVEHYDKLIATYDERLKALDNSKRELEQSAKAVAEEATTAEGMVSAIDRQGPSQGVTGDQYQTTLDIMNEIEREGLRLGRPLTDTEKLRIMQPKFEGAYINTPQVSEQNLSFAEKYAPELALGAEPSVASDIAAVSGQVPTVGITSRLLKGTASALKGGATPLDTLWNEAKTRAASMGRAERSMRITNPTTGESLSVPFTIGAMFNAEAGKQSK
jgi:hypothetical protein